MKKYPTQFQQTLPKLSVTFMNTLTVALITLQIFEYDLSFSFRRLNFSFYRSFMELIESNFRFRMIYYTQISAHDVHCKLEFLRGHD